MTIGKGINKALDDALSIGADTMQIFTRNPRGGKAKDIDTKDVESFLSLYNEHGFAKLVAHAPYTLNPCAAKENLREFARDTMADDIRRLEFTPNNYYNFHPGSHVGQGAEAGIDLIADLLNTVLYPEQTTIVLLETMAGKGSEVGRTFEEIRAIIDKVNLGEKLGVCLDTCHISDAGYDVIGNLDGVLDEFDRVIGLGRLKAIHLNDSLNPPASHKDRHARIGEGHIGLEALCRVINHPKLKDLPFILETPNEHDGYKKEIALLRAEREKAGV